MTKNMKKIGTLLYWILLIGMIAIAGLAVFTESQDIAGFRAFNITSGSMEPAIGVGSLVVTNDNQTINEGDVITFYDSEIGIIVTHRVAEVRRGIIGNDFVTKGDANEDVDSRPVSESEIIGKVVFTIPFIGYAAGFARTTLGFVLLVILPAILIIGSELFSIGKETVGMFNKKREKSKDSESKEK